MGAINFSGGKIGEGPLNLYDLSLTKFRGVDAGPIQE